MNGLEDHDFNGNVAITVKPLFNTIDQVAAQAKQLEKVLEELVKEDEDVTLLQTIPGVGLITATTIRAYTDDIDRFDNAKKYAAYAGLVPWVQNSNMTIHHGHITKRGPVELRTAFVQMVMGMVRAQKITGKYRIMSKYREMKKHKGTGKGIIASARKMNTLVYMILKTREPFDPLKMAPLNKYREMHVTALNVANAV